MYTTEESFFITLLSQSSVSIFKNNFPAKFTNKLAKRLQFFEDMEVALIEIHYPQTLCNVYNAKSMAWAMYDGKIIAKCKLQNQYVTDVNIILETLNFSLKEHFKFDLYKSCLRCIPANENTHLILSKTLAMQLGFPTGTEFAGETIIAPCEPDFDIGLPSSALVYCDIVKPQIFGDKMCQLFRNITFGMKKYKHGTNASVTFAHAQYLPVIIKEIEEKSIDIKDHDGAPLPFTSGTLSVLLHFRRRSE